MGGHELTVARSGAHKVSIVMLALGEERAAKLFALLDRQEVLEISRAIAELGHVEAQEVTQLLGEFRGRLAAGGVMGGAAATERLLARSLGGEQTGTIMAELRGGTARPIWEQLAAVDDVVLASYLANEHPQAVAVILARLEPQQTARLLALLPEEFALEVVLRGLRLEPLDEGVMSDIELALEAELTTSLARGAGRDGPAAMAAVFNQLDRATEARLMQALEQADRESAERIRSLMFTFEDLVRLDASAIQLVIRSAGNERLSLALKAASEPLRDLFFANMTERIAKMLREEMQARGPVRLKEVESAQQFLVNLAKDLAASGQIRLTSGQDEELVY